MASLYFDKCLEFSNKQAITTTKESDNVIDFGEGKSCTAYGRHIEFRSSGDFSGGTSIQFVLQDSDDGSSFTDKVTTATIPTAGLNVKNGEPVAFIAIPKGLRRFIRVKYVVSGTFTSGKISASIIAQTH